MCGNNFNQFQRSPLSTSFYRRVFRSPKDSLELQSFPKNEPGKILSFPFFHAMTHIAN